MTDHHRALCPVRRGMTPGIRPLCPVSTWTYRRTPVNCQRSSFCRRRKKQFPELLCSVTHMSLLGLQSSDSGLRIVTNPSESPRGQMDMKWHVQLDTARPREPDAPRGGAGPGACWQLEPSWVSVTGAASGLQRSFSALSWPDTVAAAGCKIRLVWWRLSVWSRSLSVEVC